MINGNAAATRRPTIYAPTHPVSPARPLLTRSTLRVRAPRNVTCVIAASITTAPGAQSTRVALHREECPDR
jgi:hypothetical protein